MKSTDLRAITSKALTVKEDAERQVKARLKAAWEEAIGPIAKRITKNLKAEVVRIAKTGNYRAKIYTGRPPAGFDDDKDTYRWMDQIAAEVKDILKAKGSDLRVIVSTEEVWERTYDTSIYVSWENE